MEKNTYTEILKTKILNVDQITEEVIDAVYCADTKMFVQRLAAVCSTASHAQLFDLFLRLEGNYAGELANILCAETTRYKKRFTKGMTKNKWFVVCRQGVPIFKIEWVEISMVKSTEAIISCRENSMRNHPRFFKSLLELYLRTSRIPQYKNIHKLANAG